MGGGKQERYPDRAALWHMEVKDPRPGYSRRLPWLYPIMHHQFCHSQGPLTWLVIKRGKKAVQGAALLSASDPNTIGLSSLGSQDRNRSPACPYFA